MEHPEVQDGKTGHDPATCWWCLDVATQARRFDKFLSTVVIDATAEMSRVYASERLWFVSRAGVTFAVMGVSSDDAWQQIAGESPSFAEVRDAVSGMSTDEIFAATEAMKRDPMYGIPYCQIETAHYTSYMGISRR